MSDHIASLITLLQDRPVIAKTRVGAMLVRRKTILSYGFNQYKTHPLQKTFASNPHRLHLHAEIAAIVNASRRGYSLEGATIFLARILKNGDPAPIHPCPGCAGALHHYGIASIHHT